ncbi:MAG: TonB-dependent receptor [Pyrinomonadaceae bacterium]|nr:TonB-dependent receptor [Pyrinomonadaceae bacterium]
MKNISLVILTFFLSATFAFGQSTTGKIVGSVSAPGDAGAIPGATIVVTDNQKGRERTVTSNEDGTFQVPQLEFGLYTVKITASGYKTFTATDLKIDAGRDYPLAVQLEVGLATEEVTVTAGAEQVNSTTGELSSTVSPQQIRELPLNGRNPLSLLNLQAGVNATSNSINGQRSSSVNYTRDGLNVQDNFIRNGFVADQPSVDNTGEFNVITQNAGAELGSGSTQVQLVTPRGGSEYHGSLYLFNRNSEFASNSFFGNRSGLTRPFLNRNEFGGTISGPTPFFNFGEGGPVFDKNKAFFFFNYEGFRLANQVAVGTATPFVTLLPAARNGTFTYTDTAGVQQTVNVLNGTNLNLTGANLATFNSAGGVFSVSPVIQTRILSLFPNSGNGTTIGTNLLQNTSLLRSNPETRNGYTGRFDYDINDRNSLNAVYRHNNIIDARTDLAAGFSSTTFVDQGGPTKFLAIAYQSTPTSNFSNEIRGGFQDSKPFFTGNNVPTNFLIGLPLGLTNPEGTFRSQGRNTLYKNLQDNAVLSIGNHSIRFGGQAQTYKVTALNDAGITPTFNIAGVSAVNPGLTTALFPGPISATDLARANSLRFLLAGVVSSGSVTANLQNLAEGFVAGSRSVRKLNFELYSAYVSDQWRVRPNLTLNAGIRYELYTPLNDPRGLYLEPQVNNFSNPVADLLNPNGVYQLVGGNAGKPGDFFKADKNNFGPNFSFAYTPNFEKGFFSNLLSNGTVIRGGFRVNFNNDEYIRSSDNANLNNAGLGSTSVLARTEAGSTTLRASLSPIAGFTGLPTFVNPATNAFPRAYALNNATAGGQGTVSLIDPNLQVQKSYEYNLGIQRDLGFDTILEVRYVGGRSNEITRSIDFNQVEIRNNGFLDDFLRAQNNCRIQAINAGNPTNDPRDPIFRCTNANNIGLPGQQNLTIFPSIGGGGGLTTAGGFLPFIQQSLPGDLVANYLATTGAVGNVSQALRSQFVANPNAFVANYTTNGGKYRYNALQAEVRRRFSNGFAFQVNYSFQKILADVVDDGQTRVNPFLDNRNPQLDYARPDYDRTHTVNGNFIYELPFGKGKQFFNEGGVVNSILGGFQFTSIINLSSGAPLSILDNRGTLNRAARSGRQSARSSLTTDQIKDLTGTFVTPNGVFAINPSVLFALGSNGQRIDLTQPLPAGVTITSIRGAAAVDQAPFAGQVFFLNGAGQTGNLQRNFINGPKYLNVDMGLSKNIRFNESIRLQLRAEAFNIFNRAHFLVGDFNVNSTDFGRITSNGIGNPRIVQFGARFDF